MISVNSYLFFGIVQLLLLALIGVGFLLFRWRRAADEIRRTSDAKAAVTDWLKRQLDREKAQVGDAVELRRSLLQLSQAVLRKSERFGDGECQQIYLHLTRVSNAWNATREAASEEVVDYQAMETMVGAQRAKIGELIKYKQQAAVLMDRFRQIRAANKKLIAQLEAEKNSDSQPKLLPELIERLEENGESLQKTISELEQENAQLEMRTAELQTMLEELGEELASTKSQAAKLEGDREKLRRSTSELQQENTQLGKQVEELRGTMDAAMSDSTGAQARAETANLEEQGIKLQRRISEFEQENSMLQMQSLELHAAMDEVKAESLSNKAKLEQQVLERLQLAEKLSEQQKLGSRLKSAYGELARKYELLKAEYMHVYSGSSAPRGRRRRRAASSSDIAS